MRDDRTSFLEFTTSSCEKAKREKFIECEKFEKSSISFHYGKVSIIHLID